MTGSQTEGRAKKGTELNSVPGQTYQAGIRYQPDEKPPVSVTIGLGLQLAGLNIAAVMLIPTVIVRAAGESEAYLSWAVLMSVAICGMTTILQALRYGRIGAGHIIVMCTSAAFIPVCIMALSTGGPAMLATLVVVAAFVPLALSWKLSLFQRVLTPTVSGTVIMLIPVATLPVVSQLLGNGAEDGALQGPALSFLATALIICAIALKAPARWRVWAAVIGIAAGSIIAAMFGLYDAQRVTGAAWVDLPDIGWPGFDLDFGPAFWTLLPSFLLVALIAGIRTMSGAVAIQRVSWRRQRAVDFRAVQGAMTVDGLGNMASGLAGTVPGTAITTGVSMTELTGVAARSVGIATGAIFILLVFLPKGVAAILAIPDSVFAGYLFIMLVLLFIVGMRLVMQDGMELRNGMIAGLAFLAGIGCQYGLIYPAYLSEFAGGLLRNGMTAGGFIAILMTLLMELTEARRSRLVTLFSPYALSQIRMFLGRFATRNNWDSAMADRLGAVVEETMLSLLPQEEAEEKRSRRRMQLVASREDGDAVLELVVAPREENLQDQLALLGEQPDEISVEREISLRLLRHLASSVRHQQFHDTDIVTVRVKPPPP